MQSHGGRGASGPIQKKGARAKCQRGINEGEAEFCEWNCALSPKLCLDSEARRLGSVGSSPVK